MRHFNRKNVSRFSALILVLLLLCSFTASYAASFTKSAAGIKYDGKTYKLGASLSSSQIKSAFGKWDKREKDIGCTFGYATYLYTFKSKGLVIETLQKNSSDKKEQIITITTTKKIPTIAGVKVGANVSTLASKYGTKYGKSGSTRRYYTGKYNMIVYTKNNKITKIQFMLDL